MTTDFRIEEKDGKLDLILTVDKLGNRDAGTDIEDGKEVPEKYSNIMGVVQVSKEFGAVEYGLAFTIDMSFKGKPDQYTENFISLTPFIENSEFEELMNKHNLPIVYEPARHA